MILLDLVEENIFEIILNSGVLGIAILGVLLILSIAALAIYFSKFFSISRAQKVDQTFINNVQKSMKEGDVETALKLCKAKNSSISRMIEKGIKRIGRPMTDIKEAVENVGNLEIFRLEKGLSQLATIAGAAPMIGFFGTVTGMILAFREMALTENASNSDLASGIYQALLTTAFGLFVGIFAYLGYNHLTSMVNKVVYNMERESMDFLDLLQDPA